MQRQFKRRLTYLSLMLLGLAIAIGFALYALSQNINLYYSPTELLQTPQVYGQQVHLGGYVKAHSIQHKPHHTLEFVITDHQQDITVDYQGVIPNLFREGQGVVITGHYQPKEHFIATQVLAKHDANYMPSWMKKMSPAHKELVS